MFVTEEKTRSSTRTTAAGVSVKRVDKMNGMVTRKMADREVYRTVKRAGTN